VEGILARLREDLAMTETDEMSSTMTTSQPHHPLHQEAGAGLDPQAGDMPQMQSPSTTARHGGGSSSSGYGGYEDGSVASPSSAALYQRDSLLGTPSSHGYQGAASAGSVERVGSGTGGAGGGAAAVRYAQQMQSPDSYRGGSP